MVSWSVWLSILLVGLVVHLVDRFGRLVSRVDGAGCLVSLVGRLADR